MNIIQINNEFVRIQSLLNLNIISLEKQDEYNLKFKKITGKNNNLNMSLMKFIPMLLNDNTDFPKIRTIAIEWFTENIDNYLLNDDFTINEILNCIEYLIINYGKLPSFIIQKNNMYYHKIFNKYPDSLRGYKIHYNNLYNVKFECKIILYFKILELLPHMCYHNNNSMPDINIIIDNYYINYYSDYELLLHSFTIIQIKDVMLNCLTNYGIIYSTRLLCNLLFFHTIENRYPSGFEEFQNYLNNSNRIINDPDSYHIENKINIPTPNLNKLSFEIELKDNNNICSICCDQIKINQNIIKIPNCNHTFHFDGSDCLGDDNTILKWLGCNKKCPTCNIEVIINI